MHGGHHLAESGLGSVQENCLPEDRRFATPTASERPNEAAATASWICNLLVPPRRQPSTRAAEGRYLRCTVFTNSSSLKSENLPHLHVETAVWDVRGRRARTDGVRGKWKTYADGVFALVGCWSSGRGPWGRARRRTWVGVVRLDHLLVRLKISPSRRTDDRSAVGFCCQLAAVLLAVLAHEPREGGWRSAGGRKTRPHGRVGSATLSADASEAPVRSAKAQRQQDGARLSLHSRPQRLPMTRAREPRTRSLKSACPSRCQGPRVPA